MNDSSKKLQKEDFAFEKKSKDGKKETIEELKAKNKQEEVEESEEVLVEEVIEIEPEPKKRPIKILEERDIQYIEAPPPNFSLYFRSYLHYKNSRYKEHKKLPRNEFNY
jgi:hypothetical protein